VDFLFFCFFLFFFLLSFFLSFFLFLHLLLLLLLLLLLPFLPFLPFPLPLPSLFLLFLLLQSYSVCGISCCFELVLTSFSFCISFFFLCANVLLGLSSVFVGLWVSFLCFSMLGATSSHVCVCAKALKNRHMFACVVCFLSLWCVFFLYLCSGTNASFH
jgi:hypothetical protein